MNKQAQYDRRFWALAASLVYLLLLATPFDRPADQQWTSGNDRNAVFSAQDIVADSGAVVAGDVLRFAPSGASSVALVFFSPAITNYFFTGQWKRLAAALRSTAVKRYLLFSCLRLGDPPLIG